VTVTVYFLGLGGQDELEINRSGEMRPARFETRYLGAVSPNPKSKNHYQYGLHGGSE
jgi:hypothetical protein